MTTERDHDPDEEAIDRLVADALTRRGDLVPTTVAEVERAEADGVEYEGELPASLRELAPEKEQAPRTRRGGEVGAAMSERVVSLEAARRARETRRGSTLSYAGTFAAGLAVAAGVSFILGKPTGRPLEPEPGAGPTPATSTSAEPVKRSVAVPAVRSCDEGCCGGTSCEAAKGELRKCASGRSCVRCEQPANGAAYRVRIANVVPAEKYAGPPMAELDLCGRVLGGEFSCIPAFSEPSDKAPERSLSKLVTASDLATGLELELRPRGTKLVIGRWRDSIRLGPNVLCQGLGALVTAEKKEDVGSLAISLDDPYYVEIARAPDVIALKARRAELVFEDVTPFVVETSASGDRRFVLGAGPFDQATAEKLRWLLVERGESATTTLGADHQGGQLSLP
ncbi:MAG: hypothetical protein HOV80_18500 [Polyangiaceae bacterium]|nr:hypothetical protein [Polyangiaceae bacterium]